jgi:hypothetical protein
LAERGELLGTYESIIAERESLLRDLQTRLSGMEFRSAKLRKPIPMGTKFPHCASFWIGSSSRFWRTFTLIAVPAAALLSGGLVWALK